MTETLKQINELPENVRIVLSEMFDSIDKFYAIVYLITKNEHLTDLEKPERYEERLNTIRHIKQNIENFVSATGANGVDLVADISSDYFEDYVNYREQMFDLTNDEFLMMIRKMSI